MATLTAQTLAESGLDATYAAASAGGDDVINPTDKRLFLHVKNGDASSHTVTVAALDNSVDVVGYGPVTKPDVSVAIPAGEDRFIGPFPHAAFGSSLPITYDAVTSVTIAALHLPR